MIRRWFKIKVLSGNHNVFDVAKLVNSPKFTIEKDLERLKNVSEEKLNELRERTIKTEFQIKSGQLLPENALELLIAG